MFPQVLGKFDLRNHKYYAFKSWDQIFWTILWNSLRDNWQELWFQKDKLWSIRWVIFGVFNITINNFGLISVFYYKSRVVIEWLLSKLHGSEIKNKSTGQAFNVSSQGEGLWVQVLLETSFIPSLFTRVIEWIK